MITLRDNSGRRMFSFDVFTDPYEVLHAVAWGWPEGVKLCTLPGCPRVDGSYCIECHMIGSEALAAARRAGNQEGAT